MKIHKLKILALPILALLAGCGQGDIRVYRVAKEAPQPDASPGLTWKLPPGWEEVAPGEMRVASFRIKGQNGKQADVSIVPLPGTAGAIFLLKQRIYRYFYLLCEMGFAAEFYPVG